VQAEPPSIPAPSLDPVHEGVQIAVVWGPGGSPNLPLNGASLDVLSDPGLVRVGGQATPGGGGQQVFINPPGSTAHQYRATQALCNRSAPSDPISVVPCAQQPAATIKPPLPGDTQIQLIDFIPGGEILVFANGVEIGHGGGPVVQLSRAVAQGETIIVLQKIGDCESRQVYQIPVDCALGGDARACSGEWPAFRHNGLRNASQPNASAASNPYQVKKLQEVWRFPASGQPAVGRFRASPIVYRGMVYVGSGDGYLYAIDAATGKLVWQYPLAGAQALTSQYQSNPSSYGIASSAAIARIRNEIDAVIFAAPDRSIGAGLGSGRIFALNAQTGAVIWRSPELARLTGTMYGSTSELHEQFGYSSPLVLGDRIFVGIGDHGDNPIQNGRVVAVNLTDGLPAAGFGFTATGTRGGGVWSSVAGGLDSAGLYVTTGNVKSWNPTEPTPNHGLSLLRLNSNTGNVVWKLQPVPFAMDEDPDWASGASLVSGTCGQVVVSTMKDGWTYAVNRGDVAPGSASVRWQFPANGFPFTPGDGTTHGDSRYQNPGAAWNDVFITMDGGEELGTEASNLPGFTRLHALNICASSGGRIRWVVDVPGASPATDQRDRRLGPPTVSRGIVYVGTDQGHLVAIADPSVWPTQGSRCSRPDITDNATCTANGFSLVPVPSILRDLPLGSGSIYTEPVLAGGRVFVSTDGGRVFMLAPGP
jgi:outer membrane protein assembly factor BamB